MSNPYSPLMRQAPKSMPPQSKQQYLSFDQENDLEKKDRWTELYDRYIKPTEGDKRTAESFNIFGKQMMSPETAQKIRRKPLLFAKGIAMGFGVGGDLLNFAQNVVGIKKPVALAPSSEHFSKLFEKLSGEKAEPMTSGEKILQRTGEGIGSLIVTGGNPLLFGARGAALRPALRTAAAVTAPAGISVHLENAKAPKWLNAAATIGSGLLLHRFQGGGIRDLRSDLYKRADAIAGNKSINAQSMMREMSNLETHLMRGGSTASKTAVLGLIRDFRQQIQGGKVPVQNLMEFRRNIHERMRDVMNVKGSEIYWNRFRDAIDKGLDQFSAANPDFGAAYRYANGISRGIHDTHRLFHFITSHPLLSGGSALFAKLLMPIAGLPTIGAGLAIGQLGTWLTALSRNPSLRKAYWQVLKEGFKKDARGTLHALNKFNKEAARAGLQDKEQQQQQEPTDRMGLE